jgi:Mg-chelatase subunit ChlD
VSFVVWAALAIAGFVVAPVVAHLLRRGRAREQEFPATALVPRLTSTARERSRLEDWPLLILRSALIFGLAVLGATPMVRCERLSLARTAGASVSLAIVLDDSLSMRALSPNGKSRWDLARVGAEELLRSAREGDAVAIVLAGKPARIALSPTTNLDAARRALEELLPSDRATDLAGAVQLARAAATSLPQKDRRIVVLGDLASDPIPEGTPAVSTPLRELARPAPDCGITAADRRDARVTVQIACTSDDAARSRTVEAIAAAGQARSERAADAGPSKSTGGVVAHAELSPRHGEQSVVLAVGQAGISLDVRLTGHDSSVHDDTAPVSDGSQSPVVAVVADTSRASAKTGGPTVVEQALAALGDTWLVRPRELVPDDEKGYLGIAAIVLDDPTGLSPDARAALGRFLEHGGVAAALLGPRSSRTELGLPLEPFAHGALRWEPAPNLGIDPATIAWLGTESASLGSLTRHGRLRLDGAEIDGARVVGRWSDSLPWLLERRVGRGLCLTVGLPASLEESDLAIRPGFLALLDHVLRQADQRTGSRRTVAGAPWTFPEAKRVSIDGPEGPLPVTTGASEEACTDGNGRCDRAVLRAVPAVRGRYTVHVDGETEVRTVTLDPAEILTEPRAPVTTASANMGTGTEFVSASRELSLLLVLLLSAEVGLRLVRRWTTRAAPVTAGDPREPP